MIDALFLVASCVGIGLLVTWMMQNDRVRPGSRTRGFFAMPTEDPNDAAKTDKEKLGRARRFLHTD